MTAIGRTLDRMLDSTSVSRRALAGMMALAAPGPAPAKGGWRIPDDARVRAILQSRIDQRHGVGMVAGVIGPDGQRVIACGRVRKTSPRPPNGRTMFEIASITKLFTALTMMTMVERGEIGLDQPIVELLPKGARMPTRRDRQITVLDVATHTSGLPRLADNMESKDENNPYADDTAKRMLAFLRHYQLPRDIGETYEYSNLGYALLGWAIANRAGKPYISLVRERVLLPLGLTSTAIRLNAEQKSRFAPGYDEDLDPAENWTMGELPGDGALRSDAQDMLTFLGDVTGLTPCPLKPTMDAMLSVVRPKESPSRKVAIGWHVTDFSGGRAIWHDGGTGGYRSFIGWNPALKSGVILYSNVADDWGMIDVGYHLLTGEPLAH